jgi:radical SAM-linked protein
MQRIRIQYAKTEPLRYTGNLDIHRIWERTLRRARLPIAYSQGFHPQPRLNQACPLPLGITSQAEMIDVWLDVDTVQEDAYAALEKALPPGIELKSIDPAEMNAPALQTQTVSTVYSAELKVDISTEILAERIAQILASTELPRMRRGKRYDLRPLVEDLRLEGRSIIMQLAAREGATGRPEEVLEQLELQPHDARLHRTALTFLSPETTPR